MARPGSTHAATSAPPLCSNNEHDDQVDDLAIALELQRFYESQDEQEVTDETIAYSLTLDDVGSMAPGTASSDGKPPPQCSCCLSEIAAVTTRRVVPCGHVYCVPCISTRCKMSVRDRSLVPAHCCKKEFPSDEWTTYERFVDERLWVANRETQLASDAEYAAVVARHGGKQCPRCGVGVEKIGGCDAVGCLRGHWFCWRCARSPCGCKGGNPQLEYYLHKK